jgi:F5/8 type C domain-containing protein
MVSTREKISRMSCAFGAVTVLLLSIAAVGPSASFFEDANAATICANLSISTVVASGNDGNVPSNTIDNNLGTRWSNYGIGSWIRADLGTQKTICSVDIAWYKGNTRTSNFAISVSNDGSSFTNVYNGKSSGTTLSSQKYTLPQATSARYVKITVNGNSLNQWASITEIDVFGYGSTTTAYDKFGIKEIYPTKANGEEWFLNMADPLNDNQFDKGTSHTTIKKNNDGSWKAIQDNPNSSPPYEMRFHVTTSRGYHPERITTVDQTDLAAKGYMQDPEDWKNVEITGYIRLNSYDSMNQFTWYARGGSHGGSKFTDGCEGTSLKGDLFFDGRTKILKEQWHPHGYVSTSTKSTDIGSIVGKWIGYKFMAYNTVLDGKVVSKQEMWVDRNANGNWVKYYEKVDSGGWGSEGDHCGGKPDQIITWGGPLVGFRGDDVKDVDFKNLSVREIQAP